MSLSSKPSDVVVGVAESLSEIAAEDWNALVGSDDPFLEYEFLAALEASGCVGGGTGWQPAYITVRENGALVAACPAYEKWDSYGEYIFDWPWADAYQRAGIPYYPKIVVACPFTPVNGPRILVHPAHSFYRLAPLVGEHLVRLAEARGASSVHVLFLPDAECSALESVGYARRVTHQFHWENRGYESFDEFVADLRSSKRKQILKERRRVAESGLEIEIVEGEDVGPEHLDAMWGFYRDTTGRKWGQAYLNREFFEEVGGAFRKRLVLVTARHGGRLVAATLNAAKNRSLFGRYWGSRGHYPGLHFECCYYRLIEYAIERGIDLFEAGAQGEHKFLRGFVARPVYSAHWMADEGGRRAVTGYLERERPETMDVINRYNAVSPVKAARRHARKGD
jgi:predicted N-acyltransferase